MKRFLSEVIDWQQIESANDGISISKQTASCPVGEGIRELMADKQARRIQLEKQPEKSIGTAFMLTGGSYLVILNHLDSRLMPDVPTLLKQYFPEEDISVVTANPPSEQLSKDLWNIEHDHVVVLESFEYSEERQKDRPFFRDLEGARISKPSRRKHQFSGKRRK